MRSGGVLFTACLLSFGEGRLVKLDDARQDSVFLVLTGLGEMMGSC